MAEFQIGDLVIGCGVMDSEDITGVTGTIIDSTYENVDGTWAVEFDEERDAFHDCEGRTAYHHGWHCKSRYLKLYVDPVYEGIGDINELF